MLSHNTLQLCLTLVAQASLSGGQSDLLEMAERITTARSEIIAALNESMTKTVTQVPGTAPALAPVAD